MPLTRKQCRKAAVSRHENCISAETGGKPKVFDTTTAPHGFGAVVDFYKVLNVISRARRGFD
jgi:hypothetical protein